MGPVRGHPALRIRKRGAETQRDQVMTDVELQRKRASHPTLT